MPAPHYRGAEAMARPEKYPDPIVPILRRMGVSFNTPEASGRSLARLVTDPSLQGVSGAYFEIGERAHSSEESYDREKARELWETSAALVGLEPVETPLRATAAASGGSWVSLC